MIRLKVFISSVQKELREERLALGSFLSTDDFLSACTVPRIFEDYPQPLRPNPKAYLDLLKKCQVYVLILGKTYGSDTGKGLSATHEEYRLARELNLPTLVCVKGKDEEREDAAKDFFKEIRKDQHTYSRFDSEKKLLDLVGKRLREHIESTFSVEPRKAQLEQRRLTSQSASSWERAAMDTLDLDDLDMQIAHDMMAAAEGVDREKIQPPDLPRLLLSRGYLWKDRDSFRPTRAGALLLAKHPGTTMPQARIQVDAFPGDTRNAEALDTDLLDEPLPRLIEQVVAFIRRNSTKSFRVEGLKRKDQPAYPTEVLRELLVNAVAHRDYADSGAKTGTEVYQNRLIVSSPGQPPGGQSVKRLATGEARSRARNPLIVQGLRWLELMDERGSGISRMNRLLEQGGYPELDFSLDHEALVVVLRNPESSSAAISETWKSPEKEEIQQEHSPREAILAEAQRTGKITTKICVQRLGISKRTAIRHINELVMKGLLLKRGESSKVHYLPVAKEKA